MGYFSTNLPRQLPSRALALAMALPMRSTMKAMKSGTPMRRMKAMKVSKIAKGVRARASVWSGKKEKTYTGLRKDMLTKNKRGKIVSKIISSGQEGVPAYRRVVEGRPDGKEGARHHWFCAGGWQDAAGK